MTRPRGSRRALSPPALFAPFPKPCSFLPQAPVPKKSLLPLGLARRAAAATTAGPPPHLARSSRTRQSEGAQEKQRMRLRERPRPRPNLLRVSDYGATPPAGAGHFSTDNHSPCTEPEGEERFQCERLPASFQNHPLFSLSAASAAPCNGFWPHPASKLVTQLPPP